MFVQFDNEDVMGLIPLFLRTTDPRPAKEQIDERYAHGGGWNSFKGFKLIDDPKRPGKKALKYPGDPLMRELARGRLRDEELLFFECSWFVILQPDGSWDCARLD